MDTRTKWLERIWGKKSASLLGIEKEDSSVTQCAVYSLHQPSYSGSIRSRNTFITSNYITLSTHTLVSYF